MKIHNISKKLPKGQLWPHGIRADGRKTSPYWFEKDRKVEAVILHHTGGSRTRKWIDAPASTAAYCVAKPPAGRGFPGMPYHYYVTFDGDVFQCWEHGWHTFHTAGRNKDCISVALQGSFVLTPGHPGDLGHPSKEQMSSLEWLWEHSLKPSIGLTDTDLLAHADVGKLACPGYVGHEWVRRKRGY